ncbi:hypothetical protein NIBR502772_06030 [Pseudarthrobacter sp. NIBRBAC000502772]|uniref:DUF7341 domain-containing protein n=1 Tax=Pseudarthrobacter sp. NIBRBAC000502772 TaxID=2590775 RepID=UPI0011321D0A|nr:hypothetical protein [Pseudarthrobacter sp. NIBRBAC000502772]QDG65832.1 hypothetical protein NIBR502772_06030 [Pseudarthrobacter sp. NIBRBAC000502772]
MGLKDNAHRLSREHLKMDKDGKAHKVPALITDLRGAVTPGRNSSGGGASGPPIPIDPDALDLLREIETEARRDYNEISGDYWADDLEALVLHLAGMDLTPEWDNYLAHVTLDFVDRITAMLWPVKPRRKLVGKVCPSCGWATYGEERKTCLSLGCWNDEGGMRAIGTWDIACGSCEAEWVGDQVGFLLVALDAPSGEVLTQAS